MPNWCLNRVTACGAEPEDLHPFVQRARGTSYGEELALSLDALIPHPDLHDAEEVYEWRRSTWGTSRDLEYVYADIEETEAIYEFETAWSPPRPWLVHVAKMFPALALALCYAEPGGVFAGRLVCCDGCVVDSYHTTDVDEYNDFVAEYFPNDPGYIIEDEEDDEDC